MEVKLWRQPLTEALAKTASHTTKVRRKPVSVKGNVWINPTLKGLDEKIRTIGRWPLVPDSGRDIGTLFDSR